MYMGDILKLTEYIIFFYQLFPDILCKFKDFFIVDCSVHIKNQEDISKTMQSLCLFL